jgi:hypothetical protein
MTYIKKLKEILKTLPDGNIIFLETTADKVFDIGLISVKIFTKRNDTGIIISTSRPYSNIVNLYIKNKIDIDKIYFLDCISKNLNGHKKANNVKFVENLSSLTDISLSISERIKLTNGRKFIFFDSINTMLIYNKPHVFARFVHNVLTRMRLNGVGGILISLQDKTHIEIRSDIAQLCDKVIRI